MTNKYIRYWEKLLKMIEKGEIDPLRMVSHRVKLEELDILYHKFDEKVNGIQKVYVQTEFSAPPALGSPSLTTFNRDSQQIKLLATFKRGVLN